MNKEKSRVNYYLGKSLYLRGLRCQKSLYLQKHHPELKGEISESQEALFQAGTDVGIYAQQLFPGGMTIPYEDLSFEEQLSATKGHIENNVAVLYEPAFSFDNVFVKVDILRKGSDGWELYEVKNSTSIKDEHIDDIAVQYYVVKGSGLPVSKVFHVCINNQYVRSGEIEPSKLFAIQDVTAIVIERQASVEENIKVFREMLHGDVLDIDIGEHCSDPYECDFQGHCWKHIPEDSIFSIGSNWIDKFAYYKQGIVHFKDLPIETLTDRQRMYAEAFLKKSSFANVTGIKDFLNSLWYPLYFLDFETFYSAVPMYDGTRPYQQVPYQYSLHYIEAEGAELKHSEYLASPNCDPRMELLKKLLAEIPTNACIIVYNQSFEKRVLYELSGAFPAYKLHIEAIIDNIRDLIVPFRSKTVYHWQMCGSASLKYVLPALVPELSYKGMAISNGSMAMDEYFRMCQINDQMEIGNIRNAMLEYCTLDTLAIVKVLEKLKELSDNL